MDKQEDVITDPVAIEQALADTEPALSEPVAPARCDCPALDVPHVHEQGGPVAIDTPTPEDDAGT